MMKKIGKAIAMILLFFAVIPLIAGFATTAIWNNILTCVCGFATINLWQGIGIFILGQILSSGIIFGAFFAIGCLHHVMGHHGRNLRQHWNEMTDEEKRAFMERRANFGFRHNPQNKKNVEE